MFHGVGIALFRCRLGLSHRSGLRLRGGSFQSFRRLACKNVVVVARYLVLCDRPAKRSHFTDALAGRCCAAGLDDFHAGSSALAG